MTFRVQKTNDYPWDPNASTYYSENSQDNDGSEPCRKGGPKLRRKKNSARAREPLQRKKKPPPRSEGKKNKGGRKLRGQWSDDALKAVIEAIDAGYKWEEVCSHYGIPRTSLRDHISGRTRSRKMDPPPILTKKEEEGLLQYLEEMVDMDHPLNPSQLKTKVAEMI